MFGNITRWPASGREAIQVSLMNGGLAPRGESSEYHFRTCPRLSLSVSEKVHVTQALEALDVKTSAALSKLLSSAAKDVRAVRVPRPQQQQQQQQQQAEECMAAAAAAAATAAAVAGWKEYLTADGKKYYHNAATRTTQWAAPPGWQLAAMAAARAGNAMRRIDTKCAVVMRVREYSLRAAPPGWQLAAMARRAPVMQCGVREILVLMQCGMRRVRVLPERRLWARQKYSLLMKMLRT